MCLEQQSTHKSQEIVELKMFRLVTRSVIARRCYADAAKSAASGLKLRFALPHETLFNGEEVVQVNLPAKSGSIGILANHVPTVEQLTPGVVEVVKANETKKYFVSGDSPPSSQTPRCVSPPSRPSHWTPSPRTASDRCWPRLRRTASPRTKRPPVSLPSNWKS